MFVRGGALNLVCVNPRAISRYGVSLHPMGRVMYNNGAEPESPSAGSSPVFELISALRRRPKNGNAEVTQG